MGLLRLVDFPAPPVVVSAEAEALFRLCFSEGGLAEPSVERNAGRLVEIAERTGLLARAGWKRGSRGLETDAFHVAARLSARRAAVQHLVQTNGLKVIGEALAGRRVSWTVLKFGALALTGVVEPGQREAGDLDILVDARDLGRATEALKSIGFRSKGGRGLEHQADPMYSERLKVCVELHKLILGVRRPGMRHSLGQAALLDNGLALPAPSEYPSGHVPSVDILVAHAAAHGLAQHGFRPQEYPLFRLPCDLIDLSRGSGIREVIRSAAPFLRETIHEELLDALADLCEGFGSGVALSVLCREDDRPCSRLARHMLGGSLSAEYSSSLGRLYVKHLLTDRSPAVSWASLVLDRVLLTRSEAERISGRVLSASGYVSMLVRNPLRLWRDLRRGAGAARPIVC